MTTRHILFALLLLACLPGYCQNLSVYDENKPFGWVTCSSLTGDKASVTGGQNGTQIILASDGHDMKDRIMHAVENYDVIVLDGSQGDFLVSSIMRFKGLRNKTIVGINNACLTTKFKLSEGLRKMLDDKGVLQLPSSGDGQKHVLTNGNRVTEVREYTVRQAIIDTTGDKEEQYRGSGLFGFNAIENIIIRNLTLLGPGAVDVGGSDLMTISGGSKNVWIDHCEFVDGMDGNFDINSYSDFITISWCKFRYTVNSYDHANTNLVGSSDNAQRNGEDNLNITFAFCNWAEGCNQRMPMARFGTIHLLNNLYTCRGCALAVNARRSSEILLEKCFFAAGVDNVFRANDDAKAYVFCNNIVEGCYQFPEEKGTVAIPYTYSSMPTEMVKKEVAHFSGATLSDPLLLEGRK